MTGAKELQKHIRFLVGRLEEIQETDGYIGPWAKEYQLTGESPNSRYDFMENDDGTQDTVKNWDTWDLYHLMYALICWYRCTQDQTALKIAVRMADLICSHFYERDVPVISVGTPETNLALEGKTYYEMPVPRWEGLHSVMAFPVLYDLTGEEKYREAFEKIWRSIRNFDRHNTGGFSAGEAACGNPYDERPIETCCTVAWMALTVERYRLEPKSTETADELELSYYNGGLGAVSPSGRWCTYNTPMDGYRVSSLKDISFQARPGTPELNCCSVNAPRIVGLLPRWCLRQEGRNLYAAFLGVL